MLYCLPPAGVPIMLGDILAGIGSAVREERSVERFGNEISRYFGSKHYFLVSSGRSALGLILSALRRSHPEKDVVLIPAYTSYSVPSAVVNAGLKVGLYDLDSETMSPDMASLKEAITERTLCVLICHLYGYPCDIDPVLRVAGEKGVPVIDDAAQAMGAKYKGRFVGTFGAAGLFSLSRGKNINAVDGGIIVTDSDDLATALKGVLPRSGAGTGQGAAFIKALALSVLLHPRCYWLPQRLPFLKLGASVFDPVFETSDLSGFQAGIGRRMLKRLKAINDGRKGNAVLLCERLEGCENISLPRAVEGAEPVFLRLPVMGRNGRCSPCPTMGVVESYPAPLNEIEALKPFLVGEGPFPGAKRLSETILTLPTNQYVTAGNASGIVEAVREGM